MTRIPQTRPFVPRGSLAVLVAERGNKLCVTANGLKYVVIDRFDHMLICFFYDLLAAKKDYRRKCRGCHYSAIRHKCLLSKGQVTWFCHTRDSSTTFRGL